MLSIVKRKFMSITEILHRRIFGHEMSDEMSKFLGNLSWSFAGGVVAGVILLLINIIAGRWLGPEEYGKYNLILALSLFFIIPMTLGLDVSAPRFIALLKKRDEKNTLAKFILKRVFFTSVIFFLAFFLLFIFLRNNGFFDFEIVIFALCFAIFLSARNIFDGILRGRGLFQLQMKLRLLESFIIMISFVGLCLFFESSFKTYVLAIALGYLSFNIFSFVKSKIFITSMNILQRQENVIKYGMYATVGAFASFLFMGSDKILVNSFFSKNDLGLYSAYFTASIIPISQLQTTIVNVFFPTVSQALNKEVVLKKINRLSFIFFVPIILFVFSYSLVFITLFGNEYGKDLFLILLFSIYATLFFFVGIKQWFLASLSHTSIFLSSIAAIVSGTLQLFVSYFILKIYGVIWMLLLGIIFTCIVFICLNNLFISVILKKK